MKTIMVIPGAKAQIPLIRSIHNNGYKVVCINPYVNSPAFKYADYSEQFDIMDTDSCINVAKKYKVCCVLSDECDIAMPSVAEISKVLGLPSIGVDLAELYTNKRLMRDFSVKNGFPCPAYKECKNIDEAKEFFITLPSSKMIIKPLDSNSSRGVCTIENISELDMNFNHTLFFSRKSKVVLCEEYIEGIEFTIDGIVVGGKHYSLAISKKKHYEHHKNIACELYFSNYDEQFDYNKLKEQNDAYVNKSGLPFGFTHAEYKFNGKDFVLIEIGARGGGNFISSHIVPIMTNVDNYKILIDETLGNNSNEINTNNELFDRCSVLKFFDIKEKDNGKSITKLVGEDYLANNSKVLLYDFNFDIGDQLFTASDDSKRIGFYIAYGDTREELDSLMKDIEEKVKFVFD